MSSKSLRIIAPLFFFTVAGCAVTSLEPTSFAPSYKSMDKNSPVPFAESCAAVSKIVVEDRRSQKELVGNRILEESAGVTQPIKLNGDVVAWVQDGAQSLLQRAKVNISTANKPALLLKIDRLSVDEKVHRLSNYESRIDITAELVSNAGKNIWSDRLTGAAEHPGKVGSDQNYQEAVNFALDRALYQLLYTKDFSEKLCDSSK